MRTVTKTFLHADAPSERCTYFDEKPNRTQTHKHDDGVFRYNWTETRPGFWVIPHVLVGVSSNTARKKSVHKQ